MSAKALTFIPYTSQGNDVRFNDEGIRDIDQVRILQYQPSDDGIVNHFIANV